MNRKFFKVCFLIVFMLFCFIANKAFLFAEEKKDASVIDEFMAKQMEKEIEQQFKKAMKVLQFEGTWSGEMQLMQSDGKTEKTKASFVAIPLNSKSIGEAVGVSVKLDAGVFEEFDVWGYSMQDSQLHMFSMLMYPVLNTRDYSGGWRDDKTLEVEWKGKDAGEVELYSKLTFIWNSANELSVSSIETRGGKQKFSVQGVLKKVK